MQLKTAFFVIDSRGIPKNFDCIFCSQKLAVRIVTMPAGLQKKGKQNANSIEETKRWYQYLLLPIFFGEQLYKCIYIYIYIYGNNTAWSVNEFFGGSPLT